MGYRQGKHLRPGRREISYSIWIKWFYFVLITILLKTILFLGLISSSSASTINFTNAFIGFPPVPVYLAFELILLSFVFLFKGKMQIVYLLIADLMVSLIMVVDLCYFRGFGNMTSLHMLCVLTVMNSAESGALALLRIVDILFIIDIPVLVYLMFKRGPAAKNTRRRYGTFAALLLISLAYLGALSMMDGIQGKTTLFGRQRTSSVRETVFHMSPIGYHIYDAYKFIGEAKPYTLSDGEKQQIEEWLSDKDENLPDNEYKGLLAGKNIVMIQVESLEKFIINQKINGKEITPNINRLLKNSIYFTDIYEQVYNGNSSDADLMANASVYPVRAGSTFFRFPENTYNSLPRLLEGQGYSTLAIHPDAGSYWNWMPALSSMGFDRCIDESYFDMDEIMGLGLSDGSYLSQASPVITAQKQPFYTFMVTLSSHMPFDLPAQYRELKLSPELDKTRLGGYFQSFYYTDKQIGKLVSAIEDAGLLDNTVIVIYGDHTGVHKYFNEEIQNMKDGEAWWKDGLRRIPFIIYSKSLEAKEVNITGGQVDILPTLCYLMGVDEEEYERSAIGRNLLKTNKSFAVLSNMEYIGYGSDSDREAALQGMYISDLIIRSNYFKDKLK